LLLGACCDPVRTTNRSEFSPWAPVYGDSQRPDRLGHLIIADLPS